MDQRCLAFPVLPGRGDVARAFMRERDARREAEYERAGRRLGLTTALWFLSDGVGGEQFVVYLEGANVARAVDDLVRSRDPPTAS